MNETLLMNSNESANYGGMQAPVLNMNAMAPNSIYGLPPQPQEQTNLSFTNFNPIDMESGIVNNGLVHAPPWNGNAAAHDGDHGRMTGPGVQLNPNTLDPHAVGEDFGQMALYAGADMGNESVSATALHPTNADQAHMYNNGAGQTTATQGDTNRIETGASPGSNSSFEKKRFRRISKACDPCRMKKAKCDGGNPCSPCSKSGAECAYLTPSARKANRQKNHCERCFLVDYVCSTHRPSCMSCHRDGAKCSYNENASPKTFSKKTNREFQHGLIGLKCTPCLERNADCDSTRPCSACKANWLVKICKYPGDKANVCTRCLTKKAACDKAQPCKRCARDNAPLCHYPPPK